MGEVDVSKYNCDSVALESLPLDKDFNENFSASQKGGAKIEVKDSHKGDSKRQSQRRSQRRQQRSQSKKTYKDKSDQAKRRAKTSVTEETKKSKTTKKKKTERRPWILFRCKWSERIGGLTKVVGYNSQPELINGEMVKSAADEKMCGGGKEELII